MTVLLISILLLLELGFMVFELTRSSAKKEWTTKRIILNAAQLVVFFLMVLLPGIDTSFRFTGLIIMLVLRIVVSGIFWLINRKSAKTKKKSAIVLGGLFGALLIATSAIPAFLFTDYEGRPVTGPYTVAQCKCILVDKNRIETFENDGSNREVPVYFFAPEEAKDGEKFPLVVFSHGAFGYYQSNASSYLELASNGYVVVSIEHPYHSFFTKDTEGKTVIVDRDFISSCMNFALDSLITGADSGNLDGYWFENDASKESVTRMLSHIDTDKIGLMGHSMGGATAVEIGKIRDDIDCVIDIDGTMLANIKGVKDGKYIIDETPYTVPLFELENENSHWELQELAEMDYPYPNITIKDTAETYFCTYVEGTLHMDYTDLPLFSPFLAKMLGSGNVDHGFVSDTVNSLEVRFFDCYLKGEGSFSVNEHY